MNIGYRAWFQPLGSEAWDCQNTANSRWLEINVIVWDQNDLITFRSNLGQFLQVLENSSSLIWN